LEGDVGKLFIWLNKALSSNGIPSTKRLGVFLGLSAAFISVIVVLSILVGISLNVPSIHYLSVYSYLLDALNILIGLMISGGTIGYVATRNNENNKERKIE
jgi:uncharacterized Tic20 family protein